MMLLHIQQYSVNITSMCTEKPKNTRDPLYLSDLEVNPQDLWTSVTSPCPNTSGLSADVLAASNACQQRPKLMSLDQGRKVSIKWKTR